MMRKPYWVVTLALLTSCFAAANLQAAVLAYEGFATDASGSGDNYQQDALLQGADKTRTGFQGAWFDDSQQIADILHQIYPLFTDASFNRRQVPIGMMKRFPVHVGALC